MPGTAPVLVNSAGCGARDCAAGHAPRQRVVSSTTEALRMVVVSVFPPTFVYSPAMTIAPPAARAPLTANQIRGFWAAWGGWALDGMDSFIYSLVLVPALTELLPQSGITLTAGNVGYYGSVLFALFLIGWGSLPTHSHSRKAVIFDSLHPPWI